MTGFLGIEMEYEIEVYTKRNEASFGKITFWDTF